MLGCWIAFMRMRSPSNAPPDFRRDGSIETIAIFNESPRSSRKRRISFALQPGDEPRERALVSGRERLQVLRQILCEIDVAGRDDLVDHALEAQPLAVLGREDARHAVFLQFV